MTHVAKASQLAAVTLLAALSVACGAGSTSSESSASVSAPSTSPKAIPTSRASITASGASTATSCASTIAVAQHQAPELEAQLPARVAGRDLATWSLRGRCLLETVYGDSASKIDALVTEVDAADKRDTIDVTHLAIAVAGRSDTKADPPYFVFGLEWAATDEENGLGLSLLFGAAGYVDPANSGDPSAYEEKIVGGKQVDVGSSQMVSQTEHSRGRPYVYQKDAGLYQHETDLFVVITDDEAWAAEALEQLP